MTIRPSVFRALIALAICTTAGLLIAAQPTTTDTHRFTAIRNGIYLAQTTAPVFNSNAVVIVNENDVVVIDSHVTPSKARDLIAGQMSGEQLSQAIDLSASWKRDGLD